MKYIANPVEVSAEIIIDVSPVAADGSIDLVLQGDEPGTIANFHAEKSMISRYIPTKGDYVVTQSDGYVYLNPREVFERKYRKAE